MDNLIIYGSYIFGFIIVLIYSINEFNGPEYSYGSNADTDKTADELSIKAKYARLAKPTLPKYMTDTSRYNAFKWIFAFSSVVLYFLFTKLLLMVPGFDTIIGVGEKQEALAAILALLLFISIVKADDIKIKNIQILVKWPKLILFGLVKDWFHRSASIPGFGCNLFDVLCYKDIDINSEEVKTNIEEIMKKKYRNDFSVEDYIERNDFGELGSPNSMVLRWARLSYLIHRLDKWNNEPEYKNQIQERSLGWFNLKEAYITLIESIVKYRDKDVAMTQSEEEELSKQLDHILASCYRLISCVVIMTAKPTEDPLSYVKVLGFKVHPDECIFSRNGEILRVVFSLVPVIAVLAFIYALNDSVTGPESTIKNVITYVESSFMIMVLPLILVRALKRHMIKNRSWDIISHDNFNKPFFERPLKIYLWISLLSWSISLVFMMIVLSKEGVVSSSIDEWKSMANFCFISALTAFITCYRTDTPPLIYTDRIRFLFGISKVPLLHGILTAITVWAGLHLSNTSKFTDSQFWEFPLLGFSIALVIGYTLFYGKHSIEKRNNSDRDACREAVIIVQGEHQYPATMLNKSSSGVMLALAQARSLLHGDKSIEIIFEDGLKKMGSIVRGDMKHLNVSYNP